MNESTRKPYITVFTPTYNRAYTLQRLYESLRKQTQHDFEWLIVDDGSTDNTESLVQEFIRENSLFNIRYNGLTAYPDTQIVYIIVVLLIELINKAAKKKYTLNEWKVEIE